VVSTIICWYFHASSVSGDFGARQDEFFAEQALQPAHDHIAISAPSRAAVVRRRRASFPRLIESLVPECWRDVILAGRSRKSSATFGKPAIVSLGELAAVDHKYRAAYAGGFI
jgi:hypothetical protein